MEQYAAQPLVGAWSPAEDDPTEPFAEYAVRRWWSRLGVPWTLWRYVALEILRIMIIGLIAVSLLTTAVTAFQTVRSGFQFTFIWPFLLKIVAYPLYFSIPLSLLFGVTLGLGRLVAELETAAMRCHSASHLQILTPVLLLGLAAASAGWWINGWVVPDLHYEKRNLQQYVLRQIENLGSGRNRTIFLPGGGSLLVGAYQGDQLWRVQVDLNRELQSRLVPQVEKQLPSRLPDRVTLLAKTGRLEFPGDRQGLLIHLQDVEVLVPEHTTTRSGTDAWCVQKFSISESFSIPVSLERRAPGIKDLRNPDLRAHIADLRSHLLLEEDDEAALRALAESRKEWHRRLAFCLSSLTFPLLGAGLCFLLDHRGRLVPFLAGNLVVIAVFYPLLMTGVSLAERGIFPPIAMAIPNVALAVLAVLLLRKVFRQ